MISLILPYWMRQRAADDALRSLVNCYVDLDLEVIIVDDGSPQWFVKPAWPIEIRVIRLNAKAVPLNPCVPYNKGVDAAKGEYIALSNPETIHNYPILEQMRADVSGDHDYVMAAAWCPEQRRWHCHSSMNRRDDNDVGAYVPRGANYHFMSMMRRELWDKAGGFDEAYRDGAGYDDPDFARRLYKAGANFVMRDDLVVNHVRTGARADWTQEMFARNRAVFMSKWQPLS